MSEFRRRLMMVGSGGVMPTNPYVTDGLVFWLDGIDKGNDNNGWKDLISGEVFPWIDRTTNINDGVLFSEGNTCMVNSNISIFSMSSSTIEVCCSNCVNRKYLVVFCQVGNGNAMFTRDSGSQFCWKTQSLDNIYNINIPLSFTASANNDLAMVNYITSTSKTHATWNANGNNVTSIGDRATGNHYPFVGVIHSIRVYNRRITQAEMLQNQRTDNQRFNLGLTI